MRSGAPARRLDVEAPSRLLRRADVGRVLAALARPGEETRLVGGCVRDSLLGLAVSDLDLATTLAPAATMALGADAGLRAIPTGFDHGTVTIVCDATPFEVTTLREDVDTDGRHAVVRFGRDFAQDAQRRDFTINALSIDAGGVLRDTTGGIADLEAGRVRFIGDAATRIREDALRILRFFRFHARYGLGEPDEAALSASIAAREAIDGLSRERVRAEFLKLLTAKRGVDAVAIMARAGILERIVGGTSHLDRLGRVAGTVEDRTGLVRLAALAVETRADAARLHERLRLSKAEGLALSAHADARMDLVARRAIDGGAMRALVAVHDAAPVFASLAGMGDGERPSIAYDAAAFLAAVMDGTAARPIFPMTGADLVGRGLAPGPSIGRVLAAARALWLERGCPLDAAAVEALVARALSEVENLF